jgi:feruloyl esterase
MRPLCPYPKLAKYKGDGESNDPANFTCAVPDAN